jgi:hypothetical protein
LHLTPTHWQPTVITLGFQFGQVAPLFQASKIKHFKTFKHESRNQMSNAIKSEVVKNEVVKSDSETFSEIRNGYYKQAEGLMSLIDGLEEIMSNSNSEIKNDIGDAISALKVAEQKIESLKLGEWI